MMVFSCPPLLSCHGPFLLTGKLERDYRSNSMLKSPTARKLSRSKAELLGLNGARSHIPGVGEKRYKILIGLYIRISTDI
jgi:hypothetical protein